MRASRPLSRWVISELRIGPEAREGSRPFRQTFTPLPSPSARAHEGMKCSQLATLLLLRRRTNTQTKRAPSDKLREGQNPRHFPIWIWFGRASPSSAGKRCRSSKSMFGESSHCALKTTATARADRCAGSKSNPQMILGGQETRTH